MASNTEMRPIEIAMLAIIRAAAATVIQIGDFFPEVKRDEVQHMLDELYEREMVWRDSFGLYWATQQAIEVLSANRVTVWMSEESPLS
jgi:hypothetical protein